VLQYLKKQAKGCSCQQAPEQADKTHSWNWGAGEVE